jgi:hypothetical protein
MKKKFRSFEEAKTFVQSLNLNSKKEWDVYCRDGRRPIDIPSSAHNIYKDKGWESWGNFIGSNTVYSNEKTFRSYEEAKKFVHTLNIKNMREWREYCKSGNRPDDIPSVPHKTYKDKGWVSYHYWFGTKKMSTDDLFKSAKENLEISKSLLSLMSNQEFREYMKLQSNKKK